MSGLTLTMPNGEIVKCLDSAENIARCLTCPLPDCVNCSGNNPKEAYRKRKLEERKQKARELVAGGMQQKKAAAVLGVSETCISRWLRPSGAPVVKRGETRRRVLELHAQGLNQTEIADRLGVTPQAVYGHLKRAKEDKK